MSKADTVKCDWPDCGVTEGRDAAWERDSGWNHYRSGWEDLVSELAECGYQLPPDKMFWLCPHHREALEAFEKRELERFKLLTSI